MANAGHHGKSSGGRPKGGRPKGGGQSVNRRLPTSTARRYPRAARVNEVLREVLAEAIERMADSDDRFGLLTVTGVTSDPELRHATVLFASLSDEAHGALTEVRLRLQALIASQVRLKRTPQLAFAIDPAVSTGQRVEEILRHIRDDRAERGDEGGQDEQ